MPVAVSVAAHIGCTLPVEQPVGRKDSYAIHASRLERALNLNRAASDPGESHLIAARESRVRCSANYTTHTQIEIDL